MSASLAKSAAERFATPVQFIKGVGPQRAELFARLGLGTASDLLFHFPRDYQDMSRLRTIGELQEDELASVCGVVEEVEVKNTGPGRSMLGVLLNCDGDHLRAVWFNQPYLRERFRRGQHFLLSGKARSRGLRWEMAHPRTQEIDPHDGPPTGEILPLYPLTEGLRHWDIRKAVEGALDFCLDDVEEVFPESFLAEHDLMSIREALPQIHLPEDRDRLERARRRFVYQELLVLQLALAVRRKRLDTTCQAAALPVSAKIDARIRRRFPFELTAGQDAAVQEIAADMARERPMNRLLQGDVGSGKTVVALYATLLAVAHGQQTAIMAPTEVLARQHALVLGKFLEESHVRCKLLTGGLTGGERQDALLAIAAGQVDVVIGTHAIVESGAKFRSLGLVVIDEQHKFGVRQRAKLKEAGHQPHYLVMTATPIPRTIALTVFGDLDVTTLTEMPPGRQEIHSYLAAESQRAKWWDFFRQKLREGRQGYVVAPLVEESEHWDVANLTAVHESLREGELRGFRLDTLHGRMSPAEKETAMRNFRAGRTQVLISTSVIEVGVDVPNATLMTIEDADRFGLAQLHQLRGRIGRGSFPGFCTLFADPKTEDAQKRLAAFVETTDGFALSEIDFELRGPGEFFGTRQHGLPPFRIADLVRDAEITQTARQDALALVDASPELTDPEFARLRKMVFSRYGEALDLGDVG